VQEAAEQLGFVANAAARSLQAGRTYTVGMITTDSIGRFSIPLLIGAEDALGAGQVSVFLCDARDDPIREQYYLRTLLGRQVDGIIVTGRRTQARPPIGRSLPVPVVYAFISSTDPADCSVVPDEAGGAVLALSHLLASGRRRIAHVTGPRRHSSALVRADATRAYLRDHGLAVRGRVRFGAWTEMWGRAAIAQLLEAAPDVDAVFCGSDQIARGVLDTLRETGRRVPDDVAVVGFDNWTVMAEASRPPLTSVDLDIDRIGRLAARHLVSAIEGREPPRHTVVPPRLVRRESG